VGVNFLHGPSDSQGERDSAVGRSSLQKDDARSQSAGALSTAMMRDTMNLAQIWHAWPMAAPWRLPSLWRYQHCWPEWSADLRSNAKAAADAWSNLLLFLRQQQAG